MVWGIPPKYKIEHQFEEVEVSVINRSVLNALIIDDYTMIGNSHYLIQAVKKMPVTIMSFFAFSRPKINLRILITKTGRITIESKYNYDSITGVAINDLGKQEKNIQKLLDEIINIVKLNLKYDDLLN